MNGLSVAGSSSLDTARAAAGELQALQARVAALEGGQARAALAAAAALEVRLAARRSLKQRANSNPKGTIKPKFRDLIPGPRDQSNICDIWRIRQQGWNQQI